MADPPQLVLADGGFDAGGLGLLENADVGAVVLPRDAENAPQAALVELPQCLEVAAIGCPGLWGVEDSVRSTTARLLALHVHCLKRGATSRTPRVTWQPGPSFWTSDRDYGLAKRP